MAERVSADDVPAPPTPPPPTPRRVRRPAAPKPPKPKPTPAVKVDPPKPRISTHPKAKRDTQESLERDAKAMELRAAGWTLQAIADELHFGKAHMVVAAISRHVAAVVDEPARVIREQMLTRLDNAVNRAVQALNATYYKFHAGEPIMMRDPVTGKDEPVQDWGPVLAAADRVESLDARRAKMLGIDAPERSEVSITQLPDHVLKWIATRREQARAAGHTVETTEGE